MSAYHTLDVWGSPSVTEAAIKGALASGKPVVVGMPVYQGFFFLAPGHSDWTGTAGTLEGYHTVTALGYDRVRHHDRELVGYELGQRRFRATLVVVRRERSVRRLRRRQRRVALDLAEHRRGRTPVGPSKGGRAVTLTGSNFAPDAKVKFGGSLGTHTTVDGSHTHITVVAPPHPRGLVPIVVTGSSGTSHDAPVASYRYETGPTVASVSTRHGSTSGRSRVVITGTNLFGGHVFFGKTATHASLNRTGTSLRVAVPAHPAGVVTISVTTPVSTVRARRSATSRRARTSGVVEGRSTRPLRLFVGEGARAHHAR